MGRQRNEQTIADIRRAIWGLFVEQGYAKTSFSAVAQRAGLQRSIVQYYFSKKEDFATIVNAQVSETIMAAVDELYPDVDKLSRYYLAIQIYFYTFFHSKEMRQFNLDILENRRLADAAMFQQINWSLELLSAHKVVEPAKLDINLINAWGGFTEVMYHGLLYQREIDIPVGVAKLVKLVAANSGYDEAIIDATMQQYCLSEPAIKQARDLVTKTIEEK
ncbi:TetR/AcrR family transcriptional regulator [Weissella confusa]|uniref:TetR/AcrR family transcriptional regulator n=1 Tax=Weissella confusa TaxID=1583 RepID=UPI0022E4A04E|nr:TetR/AcrR family transcriptional regulator [Weissella confusa]WEY47674.1 TetR/AcrR family transcriptional regulator [Weissella confusa]